MIQAIKELGEEYLRLKKLDVNDAYSILVEDPNEKGTYPNMLVVQLRREGEGYEYGGVRAEQADRTKVKRYMYRFLSAQGSNFSPTALVAGRGVAATFEMRMLGWFRKYADLDGQLQEMERSLTNHRDDVMADLKRETTALQAKRTGSALTLAVIGADGELQYLGDIPMMRRLFVRLVLAKYETHAHGNHTCGVCGNHASKIYGDAFPLKFYTLDKPGLIAGGMDESLAWRNAPVCERCALLMEAGYKFLTEDNRLLFKMGKQRYYLVPRLLAGTVDARQPAVDLLYRSRRSDDDALMQERCLCRLSEEEQELLYEISRRGDVMTLDFMFFAMQQARFQIEMLVEDVLPSRLSRLFEAQKISADLDVFRNVSVGKDRYEDIQFRFDRLWKFVPDRKEFLAFVDRTFRGVPVERLALYQHLMSRIRQDFVAERYLVSWLARRLGVAAREALAVLRFYAELGLLRSGDRQWKGGVLVTELAPKAEEFFGQYPESFNTPAHRSLFLLGVLAQKLLNIQYTERGATPFRRRLKNLRMQETDFVGLLPKIQSKLEEYDKNYYRKLEELISSYLLTAGRGWSLSTDEMNFSFVLGMNLADETFKALGLKDE